MPKKPNENELPIILDILLELKEASFSELAKALPIKISSRTLHRRLALLIEQKKIFLINLGRKKYYRLELLPEKVDLLHSKFSPSAEGSEILLRIKRPIVEKTPVGYHRNFLDSYFPNKSFYLTDQIKKHLNRLGKITNKIEPAGTYAKQIFQRLLIDLSWNSSRLEGNTYSLLETQRLLELGKAGADKDADETQMILNHKDAISFLVNEAEFIQFNRYTIFNLHGMLSNNLLGDPSGCGSLRKIAVGIGRAAYLPLQIPQLIEECFQQILDTAQAIKDPFEQSFFVTVHLPYLQPFIDVNKRVSRLSANIPLIKNNLCPLSYVELPHQIYIDGILGVYELNEISLLRDVYVWAYERSCARYSAIQESFGRPDLFQLHHRILITNTINHIVLKKLNKQKAVVYIKKQATILPQNLHNTFLEVVETQLMYLHEGNIARYQIRLPDYEAWEKIWL